MRRQHTATATVVHRSNMMTESERWDRTAAIDKYRVTPQLIEIIALALSLTTLASQRAFSRRFRGWAIKTVRARCHCT